jgi:hypothetical protein
MDTAQEFRGLTTPRRQPEMGGAPYMPVEIVLDGDGDLRLSVKGSGGIAAVSIHARDVPAVRDWLTRNLPEGR